jgi:hypothetical protein
MVTKVIISTTQGIIPATIIPAGTSVIATDTIATVMAPATTLPGVPTSSLIFELLLQDNPH